MAYHRTSREIFGNGKLPRRTHLPWILSAIAVVFVVFIVLVIVGLIILIGYGISELIPDVVSLWRGSG